jgi:hypothetical protein
MVTSSASICCRALQSRTVMTRWGSFGYSCVSTDQPRHSERSAESSALTCAAGEPKYEAEAAPPLVGTR